MNKTVAGVMAGVISIIVVGGIVLAANRNDGNPVTTEDHSQMSSEEHKQSNLDTSSDTSKSDNASAEAVQTTSVDIKDYAYAPAKIQIKKGTSVTWVNQDSVRHDVMPDNQSDNFKASQLLAKGQTYTFTFNTAGTYTYYCSPHPYMKGTVEVVD